MMCYIWDFINCIQLLQSLKLQHIIQIYLLCGLLVGQKGNNNLTFSILYDIPDR